MRRRVPIGNLTDEIIARFWAKVDKSGGPDECWPWTGARFIYGYGHFGLVGRKSARANRVAYAITTGTDPGDFCVCHRCDNPPCCNPSHLFLGTMKENMHDRDRKGRLRVATGELHGASKLTNAQVKQIRELAWAGQSNFQIAQEFGVCEHTIIGIKTGRSWRTEGYVPPPRRKRVKRPKSPRIPKIRVRRFGALNPTAKLTIEQVENIRDLIRAHVSQRKIAKQFNISQSSVSVIASGKSWGLDPIVGRRESCHP